MFISLRNVVDNFFFTRTLVSKFVITIDRKLVLSRIYRNLMIFFGRVRRGQRIDRSDFVGDPNHDAHTETFQKIGIAYFTEAVLFARRQR